VKLSVCLAVLVLGLSFLCGCTKARSDEEAIRAAIAKHLTERGGLNMAAMDMNLKQVTITGNKAQAQVEFRLKQSGGGMLVAYTLERVQGSWVVGHGRPSGGEISHPPMDQPPPATPGAGASFDFSSMDKFKKPVSSSAAGTLPPVHP
jgi:hypothetical protein